MGKTTIQKATIRIDVMEKSKRIQNCFCKNTNIAKHEQKRKIRNGNVKYTM